MNLQPQVEDTLALDIGEMQSSARYPVGCVDCCADTVFDSPVTTPWACAGCNRRYIGPLPAYGREVVPARERRR